MSLHEQRMDAIREAYIDGRLSDDELDELLDAVIDGGPPYYDEFVLESANALSSGHGGYMDITFLGDELVLDGNLYRKKDLSR